ncbi:hypothetical protein CR513_37645, partial [Mucuna pruriens]
DQTITLDEVKSLIQTKELYKREEVKTENKAKGLNMMRERSEKKSDATIATVGYETSNVLVVFNSEIEKDWVMDSGCTFHMCPRKDYFESVQGMGSIRLKMFNGRETLLSGVRYVLELKKNLISISMFDNIGYTTQIEHDIMKISNNNLVIAKGIKRNDLYILDGSSVIVQAAITSQNQHHKTQL